MKNIEIDYIDVCSKEIDKVVFSSNVETFRNAFAKFRFSIEKSRRRDNKDISYDMRESNLIIGKAVWI